MTKPSTAPAEAGELTGSQAAAIARLHKAALGAALGLTLALTLAVVTLVAIVWPEGRAEGLGLLAEYFHGYAVSVPGAAVGAAWAAFVGFIAGWFLAFTRNFVIGASIWYARTRADFNSTSDLLDHI
jgi:hypothetical protein